MSRAHRSWLWFLGGLFGFLFTSLPKAGPFAMAEEAAKIATPETLSLDTKDGIILRCTFYPGGCIQKSAKEIVRLPGKEVVPIIMLHGWKGQRREFDALARVLQQQGHAVVAVDLRGHGESLKRRAPGGGELGLPHDRIAGGDIQDMVRDVEAVRKFLLEKNNKGEVHLGLLCVVGVEMGSIVAVNWAAHDWSRQQLPSFRQGQDVKALVLVSPLPDLKGATLNDALQYLAVRAGLSVLIVVGKADREGFREANAIHRRLERFRGTTPNDPKRQTLFLFSPETSLTGTRLLKEPGLKAHEELLRFINLRLVGYRKTMPWSERKSPLPSG